MDGRDSSPAAAVEGDRISPVTDGLAKEAEALFSGGRYSECVEVLNQLLAKKEADPKVLHNIAVAEYFRDGCPDPRKLLDVLNKVKKRGEELAHSSGDHVDNAGNLGNNNSGSKGGGNNVHQLSATDTSSIAYADEFDTSIMTLNTAIVLYHLREYAHALSILEPLYQNIDPIDVTTALHVCLLLLDIALASHDASKAADVIHYLEKCFCVSQNDNGNNTQHQSMNQGPKASMMSNTSLPDASGSDSSASANINENSLSGTLSDDALEFENLYSTLDGSSQNLGRPPLNDLTKASADRAVPTTDLKLKMNLYKVRLLLLTRNLKAAKREVKNAMNMARGRDSSSELLLKSQLEYARGNHRKAVKLLMTSSNRTEPGMLSIFNNNFGCIHYHLRRHHTSGLFFSKALKNSSSLHSENPLKLSTFSQDKSLLIMYNCGIQNLACGKPFVAAQCFGRASLIFYNRPLLWLRLAECCLSALEKGLLGSGSEEIRVHVSGSGRWRQLVVDDFKSRNGYTKAENGEECMLSLPFARYCLQNVLLLLNKNEQNIVKSGAPITVLDEEDSNQTKSGKSSNHKSTSTGDPKALNAASTINSNGDSKENKGNLSSYSTLQSSIAIYEEMQREENHMIRQAVFGALAYVELCLENPLKALSFSKSLLDLPECSKIYVFLGHIYAAEALCLLNRSIEAAEHLSVYLRDGSNVELPYSNDDREKWSIKRGTSDFEDSNNSLPPKTTTDESQGVMSLKPEEARGVAFVNFSVMFAMQGDLEKASRFASEALSLCPQHPRALLATVYVDLLQEKTQEALSKLRQYSHVRYISTDVAVSW